jgi:UDP-glucose 4-epimerase
MGRRVLVTGLGTFWGGRVAQALEREPEVEVIVGLDREEPSVELERTEYVRSDENYSILSRIVKATKVDTIVHTFLVVDSTTMSSRTMHEINVIGTMNLFAAASAPGSTVRNVVVKSSTLVYGSSKEDPTWFSEETPRTSPAHTPVERSLLAVEGYVRDFAEDNPHVNVTLLRFSNVLGPDITTPLSSALELPLVPSIFGFDPRLQFVHEIDGLEALVAAIKNPVRGAVNVASRGTIGLTRMVRMSKKPAVPFPPQLFGGAVDAGARVGLDRLSDDFKRLLRYGRGVDLTRLADEVGFVPRYTTVEAVAEYLGAIRGELVPEGAIGPTGPITMADPAEEVPAP